MSSPLKFWSALILVVAGAIWAMVRMGGGGAESQGGREVREARVVAAREAPKGGAVVPASAGEGAAAERDVEADVEPAPVQGAGGVGSLDVASVAAEIQGQAPALVILFRTGCPRSRRMFPRFAELAGVVSDDTTVLAFSPDEGDAGVLPEFLAANGAMFGATVMEKWAPGELSSAMADVGLNLGQTWSVPFVAVIGEGGAVLGQWQGISDLGPVESALRAGGMLR